MLSVPGGTPGDWEASMRAGQLAVSVRADGIAKADIRKAIQAQKRQVQQGNVAATYYLSPAVATAQQLENSPSSGWPMRDNDKGKNEAAFKALWSIVTADDPVPNLQS
ncbi:unnamed protein product [Tilletia controversa]|nr:unnamed protein product [Tilletia controversa]